MILDMKKQFLACFLLLFFLYVLPCPRSRDTSVLTETGLCPARAQLVVFRSHEVELVHILVGENNERLTGSECAVKMPR